MSDPTELNKAEPHPVSSHRTPLEIAKDEAGPIGGNPIGGNPNDPDKKLGADNGPLDKPPEQPARSKSGL